jgi:hypothetical protein
LRSLLRVNAEAPDPGRANAPSARCHQGAKLGPARDLRIVRVSDCGHALNRAEW